MWTNIKDWWHNNPTLNNIRQTLETVKAPVRKAMQPLRNQWNIFSGKYPKPAKYLKWVIKAGIALFFVILFIFILAIFGVFGRLPTYDELKNVKTATASEAYTEDNVLLGRYFLENRTTVEFKDISKSTVNALVATEDSRFFEHSGVDLRSIMRVAFRSILMGDESSGGGSTLSQQLAKNLFKRKKYWMLSLPVNKVREIIIARRLERVHTKESLLTLYLNTVPFGNNVFGIYMASMRYFSKPPSQLKPEEAAVLVGMLKATTSYNPVKNPDKAKQRRNVVLDQMYRQKYLSKKQTDSLQTLPLSLQFNTTRIDKDFAPYFREHVRVEVENILKNFKKEDGSAYDLFSDGLKIYTTLDSKMQNFATEAVSEHLESVQKRFDGEWGTTDPWSDTEVKDFLEIEKKKSKRYRTMKELGATEAEIQKAFETPIEMNVFSWKGYINKNMSPYDSIRYYNRILNAGFMVMENETGKIKAWVGGADFQAFQYDHIKSRRQVGSTFKPILYARALKSRVSPCEYIPNYRKTYDVTKYSYKFARRVKGEDRKYWTPGNADNSSGGSYRMADALRKSLNLVSANLIMRDSVTPDSVRLLAGEMGIDTNKLLPVPAIALGAAEIPLYEMVQAYATFATHGYRLKPMMVTRILDAEGKEIVKFDVPVRDTSKHILSVVEADLMNNMLKKVVEEGTAKKIRYKYNMQFDIGGKTGTSQNNSDGWFIGYTSHLIGGVWVGAESPSVHFRSLDVGQGSSSALPIWAKFMQKVITEKTFLHYAESKFPEFCDSVKTVLLCIPPPREDDTTEIFEILPIDSTNITPVEEIIELPKDKKEEKKENKDKENLAPLRRKR